MYFGPVEFDSNIMCDCFNLTAMGGGCLAGFPLDKAVAYEKLRNPFVINDLDLQYCIQDR